MVAPPFSSCVRGRVTGFFLLDHRQIAYNSSICTIVQVQFLQRLRCYLIGLGCIFIRVRATTEARRCASGGMFLRLPCGGGGDCLGGFFMGQPSLRWDKGYCKIQRSGKLSIAIYSSFRLLKLLAVSGLVGDILFSQVYNSQKLTDKEITGENDTRDMIHATTPRKVVISQVCFVYAVQSKRIPSMGWHLTFRGMACRIDFVWRHV